MSEKNEQWIQRLAQEARILGEARMLRDEQALTPELTEAVLRRLRDYMARTGFNAARVAKGIGCSPSVISEILNGTYAADPESSVRKIDKWLEVQILKENAPKPSGFVMTEVAKTIIGFTKQLHRLGGIGVITGPTSCGKSLTADYLRSEIPGSILIRVTTAGCSRSAVLRMIAAQLRLSDLNLSSYFIEEQIHRMLAKSGRLVIVDEAHKLIVRRKDEGLHVLRDLHDATECPMLLIGTVDLANYINSGQNTFEAIDQISARATAWLDISKIVASGSPTSDTPNGLRLCSVEDIRKMISSQALRLMRDANEDPGEYIGLTPDAVMFLCKTANTVRAGCYRTVAKLLLLVQMQFKPGDIVTAQELDSLQASRLGSRYVAVRAVQQIQEQRRMVAAG